MVMVVTTRSKAHEEVAFQEKELLKRKDPKFGKRKKNSKS
jgi:hypothetical protein